MSDRERIEYLINLYMLTPSQFADKTGIQRASVSHILSSRNKPSYEIMQKISLAFPEVNVGWLFMGIGEPPHLPDVSQNTAVDDADVSSTASSEAPMQKVATTLFPSLMEVEPEPSELHANVARDKGVTHSVAAREIHVEAAPQKSSATSESIVECENKENVPADITLKTDAARRIKEIKIFYNNGTYETFVPEKK